MDLSNADHKNNPTVKNPSKIGVKNSIRNRSLICLYPTNREKTKWREKKQNFRMEVKDAHIRKKYAEFLKDSLN